MININENYRLETDSLNVILQRKRIVKEGKNAGDEVWDNTGYYPTYKAALRGLVKLEVKEVADLSTIVKKIDNLEKLIKNLKIEEFKSLGGSDE